MCDHVLTELRRREYDGGAHYGYQCCHCGASVPVDGRTWVTHEEVTKDGYAVPPWDDYGTDHRQPGLFDDDTGVR